MSASKRKNPSRRPSTVAAYIRSAPKIAQPKLREMRSLIAAAAPGARQELKWGMPTFSYKRILVSFAAFKRHIGFFMTSPTRRAMEKELAEYQSARSSVQFPLDRPLPTALIRKIVRVRIQALKQRDADWRTSG
jgi:uncharacterized protein YdhG (YjbR/CyaY superfamily)